MPTIWLDGYAVSTDEDYGVVLPYDQRGVAFRYRTAQPTYAEDLYGDEGDIEPTGVSVVAARIDAPDTRTLKIVLSTIASRGSGAITLSDGYVAGGVRMAGRIAYVTLDARATEVEYGSTAKPVSVTIGQNAFICRSFETGERVGNSSTTSTIERGTEWLIDTSTYADKPLWAFCLAKFNRLTPPLPVPLGIETDSGAVTIPPDPVGSPGNARWYVTSGATEVAAGGQFVGTISAAGESLRISCKLKADSVESLKPFGSAVITLITESGDWIAECTAVDTCAASGGGGGGGTTVSAIVYGGNCAETAAPFATPKTYIASLARFPTPLDPKKPVDWAKLELPITFAHGDPIPQRDTAPTVTPTQAKWPDGIGLARLCRPSVVGTKSWDADIYTPALLEAVPTLPYLCGFKVASQSVMYVYFNKTLLAYDNTKVFLTQGGVNHPSVTILNSSLSGNRLQLNLSSAVVVTADLGVLFTPAGLTTHRVTNSDGTTTDVKNTANVELAISMESALNWWMPTPLATPVVTIRDAVYDPATSKTQIQVYFTGNISTAPTVVLSAPADDLSLTPGTITGDSVSYTIDTPTEAQLTGSITATATGGGISTGSGDIGTGPVTGGEVPLRVKAACNCYVTIVNRFTETQYNVGDVIDVSPDSTISLADTRETPVTKTDIYDSRIREQSVTPTVPAVKYFYPGNANIINASAPLVEGIKRKLGEAKTDVWPYLPAKATGTATIGGGGGTGITISNRGRAYAVAPAITIAPPPSGSTATASCTISNVFSVVAVKITACGSGNYAGAYVTFSAPPVGGVTAAGTAIVRNGKIVAITITNPGSKYIAAPTVSVAGDPAFAGTAIMDGGVVATVTVTSPGTGYTSAPTVSFESPPNKVIPETGYADGVGWGQTVLDEKLLVVNDDRSAVPFPLIKASTDGGFTVQGSDALYSTRQTKVRFADQDEDADGILPCWVPDGGGP
jgi:hypothetical protein